VLTAQPAVTVRTAQYKVHVPVVILLRPKHQFVTRAQLDICVPLVWLRRKFCVIAEHILLDQLKLAQLASQAFIVHQHQTRLLGARLVLTMMLSVK